MVTEVKVLNRNPGVVPSRFLGEGTWQVDFGFQVHGGLNSLVLRVRVWVGR